MSDWFVGEIRIFPFNTVPQGWHLCDGSLLQVQQNQALFSLLGNTFGGDGRTNFALPDLRGRTMLGAQTGPYKQGVPGGAEAVALTTANLPQHNHTLAVAGTNGNAITSNSNNAMLAAGAEMSYVPATASPLTQVAMSAGAVQSAGASAPHPNIQPSLGCNICIALNGIYPQRP